MKTRLDRILKYWTAMSVLIIAAQLFGVIDLPWQLVILPLCMPGFVVIFIVVRMFWRAVR